MTIQEALEFQQEHLHALDRNDPNRISNFSHATMLAIEALEKQVPKKPKKGDWCPVCGNDVCDFGYGGIFHCAYCDRCGQAIDWSEVEE